MNAIKLQEIGEIVYGNKWMAPMCRDLTTLCEEPVHRQQVYRWLEVNAEIPGDVQQAVFDLVRVKLMRLRGIRR